MTTTFRCLVIHCKHSLRRTNANLNEAPLLNGRNEGLEHENWKICQLEVGQLGLDNRLVLLNRPGWVFPLPETNIFAPKNGWFEYYFPVGFRPIFRDHVSFREGNRDPYCGLL